ncbi:MraY family glycosyltransferase [Streptacidiphilus jiangxiensis]|uniref:UDP-GlcNAc:undecaprenyl-phosphate GlcNAc-1-phosphate transferase n=1 Tax=Streptacidiphilus jiangxiensis TaxID=235985 RepID=A0A1H7GBH4_STRJI|nr:MraY family glycosyltransferase [Streptacidiphilus jiangxiensis]SEK33830.1 UDP-GlcNAc:undecaprenyl-phosphate GlcNAc-1-phosphate transferase [Streptacidiphilus jiangxiensis]
MREFLLTLCVTAAVTYLLTGPARKFAIIAGAMPAVRDRDVHKEPTPRLGGIAMFGGLCAGLLTADHLSALHNVFQNSSDVPALLSGATIMWVLGVLDDKWGVDALVKLGGQMVAAGVMVYQGLTVLWLPIPGVGTVAVTDQWGSFITVALVVISVNAVNFIDGLDGLAAGMVCIAAGAFFVYAYRLWYGFSVPDAAPAALFSVILVGMVLGFLPHNFHPARIFMGDSGALLLGLVLSVCMISITGRVDPDVITAQTQSQTSAVHAMVPIYIVLLLPLTVIAIPLADLILAVVRRTWAGKSPFAADKQHLHHRLMQLGHSHSRAVLIMYFWSALLAFGTVAFSVDRTERLALNFLLGLCALGILMLLFPRFRPHAPRMVERFVPPRYRRTVKVRDVLTEETVKEIAEESISSGATLSVADEDLLDKIGTGSHALGHHSGTSGRSAGGAAPVSRSTPRK